MQRPDAEGFGSTRLFVTGSVARALRKAKITNLRYERLTEYQSRIDSYRQYNLPADIQDRIERAYKSAGAPRPSEGPPKAPMFKPNPYRERAIGHRQRTRLQRAAKAARNRLNVDTDPTPDQVVQTLAAHVDYVRPLKRWRLHRGATEMGALLGELVTCAAGWEWVRLADKNGDPLGSAVVPPDRSCTLLPVDYLRALLAEEGRENNMLGMFRLIASRALPQASPRSYVRLG